MSSSAIPTSWRALFPSAVRAVARFARLAPSDQSYGPAFSDAWQAVEALLAAPGQRGGGELRMMLSAALGRAGVAVAHRLAGETLAEGAPYEIELSLDHPEQPRGTIVAQQWPALRLDRTWVVQGKVLVSAGDRALERVLLGIARSAPGTPEAEELERTARTLRDLSADAPEYPQVLGRALQQAIDTGHSGARAAVHRAWPRLQNHLARRLEWRMWPTLPDPPVDGIEAQGLELIPTPGGRRGDRRLLRPRIERADGTLLVEGAIGVSVGPGADAWRLAHRLMPVLESLLPEDLRQHPALQLYQRELDHQSSLLVDLTREGALPVPSAQATRFAELLCLLGSLGASQLFAEPAWSQLLRPWQAQLAPEGLRLFPGSPEEAGRVSSAGGQIRRTFQPQLDADLLLRVERFALAPAEGDAPGAEVVLALATQPPELAPLAASQSPLARQLHARLLREHPDDTPHDRRCRIEGLFQVAREQMLAGQDASLLLELVNQLGVDLQDADGVPCRAVAFPSARCPLTEAQLVERGWLALEQQPDPDHGRGQLLPGGRPGFALVALDGGAAVTLTAGAYSRSTGRASALPLAARALARLCAEDAQLGGLSALAEEVVGERPADPRGFAAALMQAAAPILLRWSADGDDPHRTALQNLLATLGLTLFPAPGPGALGATVGDPAVLEVADWTFSAVEAVPAGGLARLLMPGLALAGSDDWPDRSAVLQPARGVLQHARGPLLRGLESALQAVQGQAAGAHLHRQLSQERDALLTRAPSQPLSAEEQEALVRRLWGLVAPPLPGPHQPPRPTQAEDRARAALLPGLRALGCQPLPVGDDPVDVPDDAQRRPYWGRTANRLTALAVRGLAIPDAKPIPCSVWWDRGPRPALLTVLARLRQLAEGLEPELGALFGAEKALRALTAWLSQCDTHFHIEREFNNSQLAKGTARAISLSAQLGQALVAHGRAGPLRQLWNDFAGPLRAADIEIGAPAPESVPADGLTRPEPVAVGGRRVPRLRVGAHSWLVEPLESDERPAGTVLDSLPSVRFVGELGGRLPDAPGWVQAVAGAVSPSGQLLHASFEDLESTGRASTWRLRFESLARRHQRAFHLWRDDRQLLVDLLDLIDEVRLEDFPRSVAPSGLDGLAERVLATLGRDHQVRAVALEAGTPHDRWQRWVDAERIRYIEASGSPPGQLLAVRRRPLQQPDGLRRAEIYVSA